MKTQQRSLFLAIQLSSYLAILNSAALAADHDYFNALVARSDHWKSYSFRNSDYMSAPWITYNPAADTDPHRQDAMKVVIPTFVNRSTLPHALSPTDTVINFGTAYDTGWQVPPQDGTGRYARIGNECMLVVDWDRTAGTVTFRRGQLGSTAVAHSAGAVMQMNTNSVKGTVRPPLLTADGNTYLFTWDSYWTDSYIDAGFSNHKTFQFSSGSQDGDAIWLEVDSSYGNGDATSVATVHMRSYNKPGGVFPWSLTNGDLLGPGVGNQPVTPKIGSFRIKPNTWVRYWVRIEQRANDYDYMDFWVADANNDPVQIHHRIPISVRPTGKTPNSINRFWIEFNTSSDELYRTDFRDLVAYVRNFVALKNPPASLTNMFQRPGSTQWLSPPTAPAPTAPSITAQPISKSVVVGMNATFSVSVTGSAPLTMQWQSKPPAATNFVNISAAQSLAYTISNAQLSFHGTQLRLIVTNGVGSVTSATATLSVLTGSACDINGDGTTTVSDVQLSANQAIGIGACTTGDINRDASCNVVDVQRVVNAVLGGACVAT